MIVDGYDLGFAVPLKDPGGRMVSIFWLTDQLRTLNDGYPIRPGVFNALPVGERARLVNTIIDGFWKMGVLS